MSDLTDMFYRGTGCKVYCLFPAIFLMLSPKYIDLLLLFYKLPACSETNQEIPCPITMKTKLFTTQQ